MAGRHSLAACGAVVLAALALLLSGAASGGTRDASVGGDWVGPVTGSGAFVAIVSDGDQIVAYVCDNGTIGSWFFGADGSADRVQLTGRDGSVLNATLGDRAVGTYMKDGHVYKFEARSTDRAVLFRADAIADGTSVLAGWIQNGNESRGTLSTGGALSTAPALTPNVTLTLNTTTIVLAPTAMTPDTLAASTANTTKFAWGAAGDSFASGEGNPEHGINDPSTVTNFAGLQWGNDASIFVPNGSASLGADLTTCHRSDQAGAPKANQMLKSLYTGMSFALGFVACSGAAIYDVEHAGYQGPSATPDSMLGFGKVTQPAQLDRIDQFKTAQNQLDALYLSIGGNDVGFGQLIQDCITPVPLGPANCAQTDAPILSDKLKTLAARYTELGGRISDQFGASLPVLISEYPNPIDNGVGGQPCFYSDYDATGDVAFPLSYDFLLKFEVTADEAGFAYGIPTQLDFVIANAAASNHWFPVDTHLATFLGHGVCTANPFANLNSAALHRQGQDKPDTFPYAFSSGFMHPNNSGYTRYAEAITGVLRQFVDKRARTGLVTPANVRIGAATLNGPITVRWNDRSTSENADEVEVLPARPQDTALIVVPAGAIPIAGGGFRQRILGVGTEQYVHQVGAGGRFLYRVRACQTGILGSSDTQCGPWSAYVNGTNVPPASPTGLSLSTQSFQVNGRTAFFNVFSWSAQPDAIEYVVRIEASDGSFTETRTSSTSYTEPLTLGETYKVSACNRIGCTGYATLP
jgi:hypothetical protein